MWNAGFPGWTSLESLIALETRDLELGPDVVVLYQGINDLQPAAHEPLDPQYEAFHVPMQLGYLGFETPSIAWYERLVLLELARNAVFGERPPAIQGLPARPPSTRTTLTPGALRVFARNVRSIVAVAREHGARVVLVTQPLRRRDAGWASDRKVLETWIPDLDPEAAFPALDALNDLLRLVARTDGVVLADAARDVAWTDRDFADPMHTTGYGSMKLAHFLAPVVASLLPG